MFQRLRRGGRSALPPAPPPAPPNDPAPIPAVDSAPETVTDVTRVGDFWAQALSSDAPNFTADVYWLAIPEVYARYRRLSTGGRLDQYFYWVDYALGEFFGGRLPCERMASLGCGTGELERNLWKFGAFTHCDAFDITPSAIERARVLAADAGISAITYQVADIATLELPTRYYDAVWFEQALHHIEPLEQVCERVMRTLKPNGYVILNEYIGPSAFDFTPRQKELLALLNQAIPARFRKLPPPMTGTRDHAPVPDPAAVRAADPSEAIRSADIMRVLRDYFEVVAFNPYGGSLLHFLLSTIAHNFRTDDPDSIKVLEMLFTIEQTLIEVGDLQNDFAVIVARPKA